MSNLRLRLATLSPEMRRYILEDLPYHLARSLQIDRLHILLTDFYFIEAKIVELGVQSLLEDYELALESDRLISGQQAHSLQLIQDAMRLSQHIIEQDRTQLAGQLLGRLLASENSDIQIMLDRIKSTNDIPWLRPLTPMLTSPGGPLLQTFIGHTGGINSLAVSPDGKLAVSGGVDNTLKVWDLSRGTELATLTGHSNGVNALAITPDGKYIISGSADNTVKLWDLSRRTELATLRGHSNVVSALAITPDGKCAISASFDSTLKVWDLAAGKELATLTGHTNGINAVSVTPDGKRSISASSDHTLKVWDLATGQVLTSFTADTELLSCTVAPDGITIVLGDAFGGVHFLRLQGI